MTSELKQFIQQAIQQTTYVAYTIPTKLIYFGKVLHYGPSVTRPKRLFKKSAGKFSDDIVHEATLIKGKIGQLDGFLLHNSYRTLEHQIYKMNLYSSLNAEKSCKKAKKAILV